MPADAVPAGALASAAFATVHVLSALEQAGLLTQDQAANAWLSLMKWRYRFMVPSASMLKTIADRYVSAPPGQELRDVARYMHSCMRDPGLFAGLEATEPPLPLAFHMHQEWATAVAQFTMDVWADQDKWPEEKAAILTHWIATRCLPSVPKNMGLPGIRLAQFTADTVLTQALIRSVRIRSVVRANKALQSLGRALGLTHEDYAKLVVEVIDAI